MPRYEHAQAVSCKFIVGVNLQCDCKHRWVCLHKFRSIGNVSVLCAKGCIIACYAFAIVVRLKCKLQCTHDCLLLCTSSLCTTLLMNWDTSQSESLPPSGSRLFQILKSLLLMQFSGCHQGIVVALAQYLDIGTMLEFNTTTCFCRTHMNLASSRLTTLHAKPRTQHPLARASSVKRPTQQQTMPVTHTSQQRTPSTVVHHMPRT